jgi:iron-sulfur cluster repair protein YtfE (RIC family)
MNGVEPGVIQKGTEGVLRCQHRRLVALLHGVLSHYSARGGSRIRAEESFAELAQLLGRHMTIEEQLVLPAFEKAARPRAQAVARSLREEHREIEARLESIAALLRAHAVAADIQTEARELNSLLAAHTRCEEWLVYGVRHEIARGHRQAGSSR